ncbi:MAG: M56 family metallopeptidase [Planctomycetes bacterium]|nr:M56 family metallopeptidase [Planctomycetota bacterium]
MTSTLEAVAQHWLAWVMPATWQIALLVAIVASVAWTFRHASPRLRYALWLLVLIKVFLPPTLAIGWSVGNWGVRPLWNKIEPTAQQFWDTQPTQETAQGVAEVPSGDPIELDDPAQIRLSPALLLFAVWSLGCLVFLVLIFWHYRRLTLAIAWMQSIEEGPLRIRLEAIALQLGIKHIPQLHLSDVTTSPFLFGVTHPRIVLPRQMAEELSTSDLNSVLLHELSHWRRRDTWIGWLQVFGQSLFWFHPLVWWANARLRHERECVCDEAVLRTGECEPVDYGQSLLGVLSAARGRSLVQGSLVGVFEPGGNIQNRLEQIMNYEPGKREFGFWSRATIVALAVLFLPMAVPALSADTDTSVAEKEAVEPRRLPWIAKTNPPVGAVDVDPKLNEITITFDRDMGSGMSPTGNEKSFLPSMPKDNKPYWRDSRTCVLPVELSPGEYYRVGINSKSYQNFKSTDGKPAPCSVICFVTRGASKAIQSRVRVPKIVKLSPDNGAEGVDPGTKRISVTFDMPMGKGMSWTGGGENFPQVAAGRSARWTNGGKTCVLSVTLKSDWRYLLGINSLSHINFQSKWGVPVEPVEYRFRTAGDARPAAERTNQDIVPATARVRGLVEDFFRNNFRDVKQRKTIEWGPITEGKQGNVSIRYKYHAKIWDKKSMIMNQIFTFKPDGEFVNWSSVEGFPQE